jgi:AcrR family transcriptional regulator
VSPRRSDRERAGEPAQARERILRAAVRAIARDGIDGLRIARIATEAGVSSGLVHYHFADREQLLAEAIDYSYARAADVRFEAGDPPSAGHGARLEAMIDACLPTTEALHEDWVLWMELWLRAVRHPELRRVAEELYERMHAWFAHEIGLGVASGEFARCDPQEVADRTLALIDGYGVRTMIGDRTIPLERARRSVAAQLARDLGLGESLRAGGQVPDGAGGHAPAAAGAQAAEGSGVAAASAARAAPRPVRTAPSM